MYSSWARDRGGDWNMTYSDRDGSEAVGDHSFEVTVQTVKVVQPAEPTEETTLYLTNIDQMLVVPVESFFVYLPHEHRSSEGVFAVLEAALGKLLVPYHFLAGRFISEHGRLHVNCNRAGAGFVVASSEHVIDDLGDLKVMNPEFRKLVPSNSVANIFDDFLLMIQVTRFRCGGFTVAFRHSHAMMDGFSSALFFNSFCKLARGEGLTTFPDLDRTILKPREPPSPEFSHPECFKLSDVARINNEALVITPEYITKHIPMTVSEIQALKAIAMADGNLTKCSSFEATVAHFWQARTRSLEFHPSELSSILIAVDFRSKFQPQIPATFCGNTITSAHVSAPAAEVARSPLSFCVAKIQEAVARIDERYVRSALDWLELHGGVPAVSSAKDVLVSAWNKLPFYEHDFGWGKPVHAGPPFASTTQYALLVATGNEDDGGLLLLVSFRPHEMANFEHHLKSSL